MKGHQYNQYGSNNSMWKDVNIDEIIKLYTVDKFSTKEIAKRYNVSRCVIRKRLKNSNIELRDFSKQYYEDKSKGRYYNRGDFSGENNSQYKHGKLVGEKANRKKYLELVKDRKWECEKCFKIKTNENFDLVVHHKDSNNKNNNINNLMILCQSCHTIEHYKKGEITGHPRKEIDTKKIIYEYTVKKKSLKSVGVMFNVTYGTIKNRLLENNIKIRSYSEQYWLDKQNGRSRNFGN